jgi:prepilin signal peptidase PulO-like enzyme (type II secretory pathway)
VQDFFPPAGGRAGGRVSPAGIVLGAALAAIAAIDLRTLRIPDWLSLPLVAAGLLRTGALARSRCRRT